ncbi:UDP-2,3-diacylglucosamine diphosphatase [Candidatus Tachikawaea gelatinosa]|uniref:UDP-2,3-diacylglucosamine hydrolase n=1 Tax=Candidatus Tachikawaea gelatinosa TaxID=1410383 RepID=A0A090AQW6_9ENTR|nr:UDP-2,3-diacylglucosamine diphosphatase [Candidatus Tachikawaea gelatinosa]BAP58742.1 UDP-2 3-diacylglucosamine hydrolase [Candidatus Tachikawaea gelatinosa]
MSHTLFISDLHLSQKKKTVTKSFFKFLKKITKNCDALYILGDLFEIWIGEDYSSILYKKVTIFLSLLTFPVYFIHGNKDFLINETYANKSNMIILPEKKILFCYGYKILITHGDIFCTKDFKYQQLKKILQKKFLKNIFLLLPLFIRKKIGAYIQNKSKKINKYFRTDTNIDEKKVFEIMNEEDVQILIHGHTHKSGIHKSKGSKKSYKRIVLSKWKKNKGSYVRVDENGINLCFLNFDN